MRKSQLVNVNNHKRRYYLVHASTVCNMFDGRNRTEQCLSSEKCVHSNIFQTNRFIFSVLQCHKNGENFYGKEQNVIMCVEYTLYGLHGLLLYIENIIRSKTNYILFS